MVMTKRKGHKPVRIVSSVGMARGAMGGAELHVISN